jgi:WD40 repeat protein
LLPAYPFPAIVNALTFTPNNRQVVVGGHHELTVWDANTGKLTLRLRTRAERAYGMAFLPDGKLVVAGGRPGQEGDVRIYDLKAPGKTQDGVTILDGVADGKVMLKQLLDVDDSVLALALSPDGKTLAAGGCDRAVRVWDLSEGWAKAKLQQTVENHADWVLGVALTADGKFLLSAGRDKTAKVWDLKAKESVLTYPDHQAIVYAVAALPDGAVAFSVGADKSLRSWKTSSDNKPAKSSKAPKPGTANHNDEVFKVVASPTEPVLATASADKTVRLWKADNVSLIRSLSGLTDYAYALAFSPDGTLVAAGAYDGEVRIWKVADGSLVKGFNASPGYVPSTAAATESPVPKR